MVFFSILSRWISFSLQTCSRKPLKWEISSIVRYHISFRKCVLLFLRKKASILWRDRSSNVTGRLLCLPKTRNAIRCHVKLLHIFLVVHWRQVTVMFWKRWLLIDFPYHIAPLFQNKASFFENSCTIWLFLLYWFFICWEMATESRLPLTFHARRYGLFSSFSLHQLHLLISSR